MMLLLLALGLTGLTVIIHALGTLEAIAHLSRVHQRRTENRRVFALEMHVVRIVIVLLLLHILEAVVWAAEFSSRGAP